MSAPYLAVDPGIRKIGYALLDEEGAVLLQGIEPTGSFIGLARRLCAERGVGTVVLGGGTYAGAVLPTVRELGLPVHLVDERETTLRARALYFADHPRRGWRWLVPVSFQVPPRPIDDYAAILIGRRYLSRKGPGTAS